MILVWLHHRLAILREAGFWWYRIIIKHKHNMKVRTRTILAVTFTAYCIAMAVMINEAHEYSKTKRCLEEYGEGDAGMCMCYENCK